MIRLVCCVLIFILYGCNHYNKVGFIDPDISKETIHYSSKLDSITINKLPYEFKYDYDDPTIDKITIDVFLKENKDNPINTFFSDSTNLPSSTFKEINFIPHRGEGLFLKRFPNVEDNKLLLFVYNHSSLDYFLPIFELQMFDNKDSLVDKLIVAGGLEYECGWDRSFKIEENFNITIHNLEYCYDIENDVEIFSKEIEEQYKITSSGFKLID